MKPKTIALTPATLSRTAPPVLRKRLACAASYLRGGPMADVGTDHAYLPLYALLTGKVPFAVATDIHEGPAKVAAANLSAAGLDGSRAAVLWTDGLAGAEPYVPEDICVLGMGGETVVHVLSEAPFLRQPGIRLILQPMTHPEILRKWLGEEGFSVTEEALVEEEKIYQILCAAYTGVKTYYTPLEALAGKRNLTEKPSLLLPLLGGIRENCRIALAGKRRAGSDTATEEALLAELAPYFENREE